MEPRAVADAVETGEEDVIVEALRAYNREVSGTVEMGRLRRREQGGARVFPRRCGSGTEGGRAPGRGAEAARSCWGADRVRTWRQVCRVGLCLFRAVPAACAL